MGLAGGIFWVSFAVVFLFASLGLYFYGRREEEGLSIFWVAMGCLFGIYFNRAVISRRLWSLSGKLRALIL